MIRSPWNGPRSLTRTTTSFPVTRFRTETYVGRGSVLWAAVILSMSQVSPLEVRRPWSFGPYHDAIPRSTKLRAGGRVKYRLPLTTYDRGFP